MGEVAADADAFVHGVASATGWARVGIAKPDLRVNEIADRLHDSRAAGQVSKPRPGEIGELVAVAIPARDQEQKHVVGKVGDGRRPHIRRRLVQLAGVVNDEAIGECDKAGGDLDARDAITEKIDIGAHRKRRIGGDFVGREQVSVTGGMDVELKEHRRLSRTIKCDVIARFDQHWEILEEP